MQHDMPLPRRISVHRITRCCMSYLYVGIVLFSQKSIGDSSVVLSSIGVARINSLLDKKRFSMFMH